MKRVLLACLISAMLGAMIAGWMRRPNSSQQLNAQEVAPPGTQAPLLIDDLNANRRLKTQPIGGPQPDGSLPGLDEYTPEERINISVYEKRTAVSFISLRKSTARTRFSASKVHPTALDRARSSTRMATLSPTIT